MMMEWNGKRFYKISDIIDFALSLTGITQEAFVEKYCSLGPYKRHNIGYLSGYYDHDTAKKILEVFKVNGSDQGWF